MDDKNILIFALLAFLLFFFGIFVGYVAAENDYGEDLKNGGATIGHITYKVTK